MSTRRIVWVLFISALALRSGWVGWCWVSAGAGLSYPDEELHWSLARNLDTRGVMVSDDGRYAPRMPLYPLFLALFAWLGPDGILVARLAQAALGAAVAPLVYRLVRGSGFGERAALAGAVLACIDPFAIFFSNLLLIEAVFAPVALLLIGSTIEVLRSNRSGPRESESPGDAAMPSRGARVAYVVSGAAAILLRPEAIVFVWLVWLLTWWRAPKPQRAAVGRLVLLSVAVAAAVLLPWGLRNHELIGSTAMLSTNGGVTLYDAQGPQADGSSDQSFLIELPEIAALPEAEQDAALRGRALQQMGRDPLRVVMLAGAKLARTWNPFPNVAEHRGGAAAAAGAVYTVLVLVLAVVGTWRGTRGAGDANVSQTRREFYRWVWLPVIYFTLVSCFFIGSVRYRVPLMPLLAAAAGTVVGGWGLRQNSHHGDSEGKKRAAKDSIG